MNTPGLRPLERIVNGKVTRIGMIATNFSGKNRKQRRAEAAKAKHLKIQPETE